MKTKLMALAVCVGVCSVCFLTALGDTVNHEVSRQVKQTGISGITLYPKDDDDVSIPVAQAQMLLEEIGGIRESMPFVIQFGSQTFRYSTTQAAIFGIGTGLQNILGVELLHGRLPSKNDVRSGAYVAVVDEQLANDTYKRTNVVGKSIELSFSGVRQSFEVIGVVKAQKNGLEALAGTDMPAIIYVPFSAINEVSGQNSVDKIAISCMAGFDADEVAEEAAQKLQSYNDGVVFGYQNLGGYVDGLLSITSLVSGFVKLIAYIAILVGGIGVMNSMVSSIEQRRSEIGIYMALGSTKKDILLCFLYEAVLVCLLGGLAGALISGAGFFAINQLYLPIDFGMCASILAWGVMSSLLCGVLFGILPAYNASKMNPIDAIKQL